MNMLTVADIAKKTRIPAPTARRYASLFKDFLDGRKAGRVTRYPESSVVVFERISALYAEGRVTNEIEEILHSEMNRTIDVDHVAPAPAAQPDMTSDLALVFKGMMGKVTDCMEVIADQKSMIERQNEDIQRLKTAFVMLARSQKKLKELPQSSGVGAVAEELVSKTRELEQKDVELEEMALGLSFDTSDIKVKLQILENELVRLRKDRREMEKYLQDKIERLKETAK
jgi:DNA-binding transcriptional MerR regulator